MTITMLVLERPFPIYGDNGEVTRHIPPGSYGVEEYLDVSSTHTLVDIQDPTGGLLSIVVTRELVVEIDIARLK